MTPLQEYTMSLAREAGFKPCKECGTPSPIGKDFCDNECEQRYINYLLEKPEEEKE
jgi:hypothetical protein